MVPFRGLSLLVPFRALITTLHYWSHSGLTIPSSYCPTRGSLIQGSLLIPSFKHVTLGVSTYISSYPRIYLHIYTHIYTHVFTHLHIYIYVSIYVYVHIHIYPSVSLYIHSYHKYTIYVYLYTYMLSLLYPPRILSHTYNLTVVTI